MPTKVTYKLKIFKNGYVSYAYFTIYMEDVPDRYAGRGKKVYVGGGGGDTQGERESQRVLEIEGIGKERYS